jgi:hypothetical protein
MADILYTIVSRYCKDRRRVGDILLFGNDPIEHRSSRGNFIGLKRNPLLNRLERLTESIPSDTPADGKKFRCESAQFCSGGNWIRSIGLSR